MSSGREIKVCRGHTPPAGGSLEVGFFATLSPEVGFFGTSSLEVGF
ncbi:MAG TPA: hypothetical protein VMB35_00045 [Methanomicrobiales archaeon]|nr:hypothetical protein [Methanomicrobiales archaeon]